MSSPLATVVFSTQLVREAEQVATRVAILHGGRIAGAGTVEDLKARHGAASLADVLHGITGENPAASVARFLES